MVHTPRSFTPSLSMPTCWPDQTVWKGCRAGLGTAQWLSCEVGLPATFGSLCSDEPEMPCRRKVKTSMTKVWQKVYDANYHKSLDHRSFYFKQVRIHLRPSRAREPVCPFQAMAGGMWLLCRACSDLHPQALGLSSSSAQRAPELCIVVM
jgi:hypothetical protein